MNETTSSQLAQRSLAAVKWSYLGVVARVGAQLFAQIMLARLLGPETFGIFAAVLLVVSVGSLFVESGVGPVLIQSRDLNDSDRSAAVSAVLINAMLVSVVVILTADLLAGFFSEPELALLLVWIWPAFLLHGLSIVPMALLRRDLDFKSIQLIQVLGYSIGFLIVGVSAAWLGAGIWSLVAAWLTQVSVVAVLANMRRPSSPSFRTGVNVFWLHPFGVRVLLTNLVNWFIENIDNLIVGRFFGSAALGLYSVAYNFVRNPTNHLVSSLQAVLFPASARTQDDDSRLARAYLTAVAGIALVAFPVFFTVAAVSESVTLAVFGVRWAGAAAILVPLSLAMPLHAMMAVAGPVLLGKGIAGIELKVQALTAVFLAIALYFASSYGVVAVGWAVLAVYFLRCVVMTGALVGAVGLPIASVFAAIRGALALAVVVALVVAFADAALTSLTPLQRTLSDIAIATFVLIVASVAFPKFFVAHEVRTLIARILAGRPAILAWAPVARIVGRGAQPPSNTEQP